MGLILNYDFEGNPCTLEEWVILFNSPEKIVAKTDIESDYGSFQVSTVWLGIDHGFGFSKLPLIYETMVFWIEAEDFTGERQVRYPSRTLALAGHDQTVMEVKAWLKTKQDQDQR